jgi:hypothetical protein
MTLVLVFMIRTLCLIRLRKNSLWYEYFNYQYRIYLSWLISCLTCLVWFIRSWRLFEILELWFLFFGFGWCMTVMANTNLIKGRTNFIMRLKKERIEKLRGFRVGHSWWCDLCFCYINHFQGFSFKLGIFLKTIYLWESLITNLQKSPLYPRLIKKQTINKSSNETDLSHTIIRMSNKKWLQADNIKPYIFITFFSIEAR